MASKPPYVSTLNKLMEILKMGVKVGGMGFFYFTSDNAKELLKEIRELRVRKEQGLLPQRHRGH